MWHRDNRRIDIYVMIYLYLSLVMNIMYIFRGRHFYIGNKLKTSIFFEQFLSIHLTLDHIYNFSKRESHPVIYIPTYPNNLWYFNIPPSKPQNKRYTETTSTYQVTCAAKLFYHFLLFRIFSLWLPASILGKVIYDCLYLGKNDMMLG